jgi:ParB family chromosome partitioning protein
VSTQINRLGKGLDALIPSVIPNTDMAIIQIPIEQIIPNPYQPRQVFNPDDLEELAHSIKEHGLAQPIIVRKVGGRYELVVGERRLQACKLNNLETIPAIVKDISNQQSCEIALVENIDRENLNVIEIALAFKRLIDEFNYTQESISNTFGRSRSSIANILRLLKLPCSIQAMVKKGGLSEGHARTLIDFSNDEALSLQLANEIINRNLNVRESERFIKTFRKQSKPQQKQLQLFDNYIETLSKKLKTNVGIKHRRNQLSITVEYDRFKDYISFLDQLCTIEMNASES